MRTRWFARSADATTAASAVRGLRRNAATIAGVALLAHMLWLLPLPLGWRGAGAELLLALPGALLAVLLFEDERDPLVIGYLALCGAAALQAPLLLALHVLPGPLPWMLVLAPCDALSALLGWLLLRRRPRASERPTKAHPHVYLALAGVLLIGAALRLLFLGGAELQGDEARALLLGLDAVVGREDILLWHSKGPVEVLLPAGLLALIGNINEWAARLPFALAGAGVPLGAYLLARHIFGAPVREERRGQLAGLTAAAILALDGFLIAFSRIVQYQNVLVLLTIGALWCCWRFYAGVARPQPYLIGAGAFAAVGLLAHYDALFALPPLAWLVIAGGRRRGWRAAQWARGLAAPLAVGTTLVASFYIPFILHEHFRRTLAYLQSRTGQAKGGLALFNNLADYYRRATFYNTTFQINWLAAALALSVLVWVCMYVRPRALGWGLAAALLAGAALQIGDPARLGLPGGGSWAILAIGAPLAVLALAPATPAWLRMLVLWFAPPFIAEAFLFVKPMTHFYTVDAAAALLAGAGVAGLVEWLRVRGLGKLQPVVALGGAVLLALTVPYMYLVFVRQTPEYRAVFPAARPEVYRAIYGDQLPSRDGYFGFPHRAGWKVVGELYRAGILRGDFESNEDFLITHWYTNKAPRCDTSPAYYFLARSPIDPAKVPLDQITRQYHLFGSVLVDGVEQIAIYSRRPAAQPARTFALGDYVGAFERHPLVSRADQATLLELMPEQRAPSQWRNGLSLQGDNLEHQWLVPHQDTVLAFQWRAAAPLDRPYEAFVDIADASGQVAGQIGPLCNDEASAQWHTRAANETSVIWAVATDLQPGMYTLQLGLRDAETGAVLPLADGARTLKVATLNVAER